jgi:hypothetical protein
MGVRVEDEEIVDQLEKAQEPNNLAAWKAKGGVGDEAYFMSRGPMMPYARAGTVAIGLEGFPNTPTSKAGAELLRIAVGRVR